MLGKRTNLLPLWLATFGLSLVVAIPCLAEPPAASYIFPAGGQRGTTVEVRVGGMYLHDRCPLHWDDAAGLTPSAEVVRGETTWFEGPIIPFPASSRKEDYPKDYLGTIAIDQDAEPGSRFWRVSTSQGVTESRPFMIGNLPEVVEREVAGSPIPVDVTLPVTINGRVFPHEDVDEWQFQTANDGPLTLCVDTTRIDSPLRARLVVLDSQGQRVIESTPTDPAPVVQFAAEANETYRARIFDANFDGYQHYVYRLTITDEPWIASVYPLGGRRSSQTEFTPHDGSGAVPQPIAVKLPDRREDHFSLPLPQRSQVRPVSVAVGDSPEHLEPEPDNRPPDNRLEDARLALPASINGRIETAGDVDVWSFDAEAGSQWEFEMLAYQLGSPLDGVLTIRDSDGKQLATADDIDAATPDPRLSFRTPKDGRYYLEVQDRFSSRGGSNFAYRVHIETPRASCEVVLGSDAIVVPRAGQAKLAFEVHRRGNATGDLKISALELPEGVVVPEVVLKAKQTKGNLVFEAAADTRIALTRIHFQAELLPPTKKSSQDKGGDESSESSSDDPIACPVYFQRPSDGSLHDDAFLAVAAVTPFEFSGEFSLTYASRGSHFAKTYVLDRGGYEGPLEVRLADRQARHLQGVSGTVIEVPGEADSFEYPVYLPPWMELGRTSRSVIMATGEITDEQGNVHKVCYTEKSPNQQLIAIVSPAAIRLECDPQSIVAIPDSSLSLGVEVRRSQELRGSATRLELVVPSHVTGVQSEATIVPAGETQGVIVVRFAGDAGPFNAPLVIRATALKDAPAVTGELKIDVVTPNPVTPGPVTPDVGATNKKD